MGFIVPDPQELIFGEALNSKITNFLFTCAIAIVLFEQVRKWLGCARKPATYTLKMKKLKNLSGEFLQAGATWDNAIGKEHNFLAVNMADIIDYSVMKLVSDDVQILSDQEHQHAKLHHMQEKVSQSFSVPEMKWVRYFFDKLFLRLPRALRAAVTLFIESISPLASWLLLVNPVSKGMLDNLMVFHMFEEIEHAPVTCHHLKEECPFFLRVIGLLLFAFASEAIMFVGEFAKIPLAIYHQPSLIFRPKFWLIDIPVFYINLSVQIYLFMPYLLVHYVFAVPHFEWMQRKFLADAEAIVKERGFEWDVVREETFVLDKSLRKRKAPANKFLDIWFYWSFVKPVGSAVVEFAVKQLASLSEFLDRSILDLFPLEQGSLEKHLAQLGGLVGLSKQASS